MSRRVTITITAALLSIGAAFAQVKDYRDIKTPALRQVTMPQPKRVQLANGMVLFLMEDHELPLIRANAFIRGGGRDVPAAKTGLDEIYGQAWRTGGTKTKTGDELDAFLEARAARVETGADEDSSTISMDVLKADFDTVFPIYLDLLRNPEFRQDKIDLAKTQANTGISRRNDDPRGLGDSEAAKIGYGADSPYARQEEYATIAAITRDDLLAFHKRFVQPNNIIFGIVGDFDAASMEKRLRDAFASWPKGAEAPKASSVAAGTPAKPGVYLVSKDDVTQSNIYVLHGGTTRNNPDYYALVVMNEILSGGFSGRLMNDIRTARGLAYGVGGGVGAPWDHPGLFRIWMGTKSGSTVEAINALKTQLSDLTTKPFSAEELAQAKEGILNAYVFTADSKRKILNQRLELEFYGFPADYYQQYPSNIQKVSAEDVARVAKKYVHPDQISVLVVGKEKDFDKPISSLGTVTPVDVTIAEPGMAKPAAAGAATAAAPAASSADAKALMTKVRDFVGGKAKIDSVKATRSVGTMSVRGPQGPMEVEAEVLTMYPDSRRTVLKTPMGEITTVASPNGAFMMGPMGTQDVPSSQREAQARDARGELLTVLKNIDNPKYTFTLGAPDTIDVNADGAMSKWVVDPATGKILKKISQGRMGEQTAEYTEWKTFDGLTLPVAFTIKTAGGEQTGGGKTTTIEINPAVDPKVFEKPSS